MLFLICILTLGVTTVVSQCPESFERHGNNCYKVMLVKTNWIESYRYCQTIGGYLADIKSEDEQHTIEGLIARYHGGLDIDKFWIGGGDMFSEFEYMWYLQAGISEPLTGYTNYARNQPDNNNGNEHCLSIEFNGHTAPWNDKECNEIKYFVCKARMETQNPVVG